MPLGAGKYDAEATYVRERTEAHGVIVIVINGRDGSGFSAQFVDYSLIPELPGVLEDLARDIRKDISN